MLKLYKNFKINRIKYNSMYTILLDTIINYSYIVFLVKFSIIENFTKNLYKELYKELYNFNKYINNNIVLIKVEFSI